MIQGSIYLFASKQLAPYEYWTAKIQKTSLCKSIFYDLLYSFYIMMIQIRISNLWIKIVFIMRPKSVFVRMFRSISQKISFFKKETLPLQLHFIYSTVWNLHKHVARCGLLIFWNNIILLSKNLSWLTSDHSTKIFYFRWFRTYWCWLYSYRSFSALSTFVRSLWPPCEW